MFLQNLISYLTIKWMFSRDYLPTYGSSHKIQKQKILERMKAKFTREQFLLLPKHVFNTRNLLRNGVHQIC